VHVEASTERRIILAGFLLKIGTYGLILILKIILKRLLIFVFFLRFLGILLINIINLIQSDLKSFLAYSSVIHINFLIINIIIIKKNIKIFFFHYNIITWVYFNNYIFYNWRNI